MSESLEDVVDKTSGKLKSYLSVKSNPLFKSQRKIENGYKVPYG